MISPKQVSGGDEAGALSIVFVNTATILCAPIHGRQQTEGAVDKYIPTCISKLFDFSACSRGGSSSSSINSSNSNSTSVITTDTNLDLKLSDWKAYEEESGRCLGPLLSTKCLQSGCTSRSEFTAPYCEDCLLKHHNLSVLPTLILDSTTGKPIEMLGLHVKCHEENRKNI